jgi:hypothetical protein
MIAKPAHPPRVWVDHEVDYAQNGMMVDAYCGKTMLAYEYLSMAEHEAKLAEARANGLREAANMILESMDEAAEETLRESVGWCVDAIREKAAAKVEEENGK